MGQPSWLLPENLPTSQNPLILPQDLSKMSMGFLKVRTRFASRREAWLGARSLPKKQQIVVKVRVRTPLSAPPT